jgi:hypothetical protein
MKWLILLVVFSANALSAELTQTQKAFITWGHTCCYSQEVIDSVQLPTYDYQPYTIDLDLPPFREPASKLSWSMFYALQVLDVYTTDRALEYDCVEELNPILGKSPNVQDVIGLKVVLLVPALWYTNKYETITDHDLGLMNYMMTSVVVNNIDVLSEAKDTCDKIR